MNSWVRRIAKARRLCANCDDWIYVDMEYFLMASGETYCDECPPEDEGCSL